METDVVVCASPGAELRLRRATARHIDVEVLRGRVVAELAPRAPGSVFALSSRGGVARALGTAFSVEVPETGPVVTRVLHGRVLVTDGGRERQLGARMRTSSEGVAASSPEEINEDRSLLDLPPSDGADMSGGAWSVLRVEQVRGTVVIDGHTLGPAPVAALLRPGPHALEVQGPHDARRRDIATAPGETRVLSTAGTGWSVAKKTPLGAGAGGGEASGAVALLTEARRARSAHDANAAQRAYERLFREYPGSDEALVARVAFGELALAELGAPQTALASFDAYLERGGSLEAEARFGRIRALRKLGRTATERAEILRFLELYPTSVASRALRERLRTLDAP
jgi:hypothetical protein